MTDSTGEVLTMGDAVALQYVLESAQGNRKVARITGPGPLGIIKGTARSIGDERGNFADPNAEVRDQYLRVTLETGFEAFWPVRELMDDFRREAFLVLITGEL